MAAQVNYFAARGEAVEWKLRGHDRPADLPGRPRAAAFVPEEQETVLIGLTAQFATATTPVQPDFAVPRQVTADAGTRKIADMQSAVWEPVSAWAISASVMHSL